MTLFGRSVGFVGSVDINCTVGFVGYVDFRWTVEFVGSVVFVDLCWAVRSADFSLGLLTLLGCSVRSVDVCWTMGLLICVGLLGLLGLFSVTIYAICFTKAA